VNELIASVLFTHLTITSPDLAAVRIGQRFLARNPDFRFVANGNAQFPECGLHLGSKYPGDPNTHPVYDFVPDCFLPNVANLSVFRGALVADKWLSNGDGRQAVFVYATMTSSPRQRLGPKAWVAVMIDNGAVFQGDEWTFRDSAPAGIYARPEVYGKSPTLKDFEPWLDNIAAVKMDLLEEAVEAVPAAWKKGEEAELARLMKRLYMRRAIMPNLVGDAVAWLRERRRGIGMYRKRAEAQQIRLKSCIGVQACLDYGKTGVGACPKKFECSFPVNSVKEAGPANVLR
jgi:hypothetical protein